MVPATTRRCRRLAGRRATEADGSRLSPDLPITLVAGIHPQNQRHPNQLKHGQGGRQPEVAEHDRLAIDLDLEGRVGEATQDEDHAEGREREQKHDRGGGHQGRTQQGERDGTERLPAGGPKRSGCFLQAGIEMRPQPAHRSHHHRQIEEHVGGEDDPDGPGQVDPDRALASQQGEEGRPDDDGRHHEREW